MARDFGAAARSGSFPLSLYGPGGPTAFLFCPVPGSGGGEGKEARPVQKAADTPKGHSGENWGESGTTRRWGDQRGASRPRPKPLDKEPSVLYIYLESVCRYQDILTYTYMLYYTYTCSPYAGIRIYNTPKHFGSNVCFAAICTLAPEAVHNTARPSLLLRLASRCNVGIDGADASAARRDQLSRGPGEMGKANRHTGCWLLASRPPG